MSRSTYGNTGVQVRLPDRVIEFTGVRQVWISLVRDLPAGTRVLSGQQVMEARHALLIDAVSPASDVRASLIAVFHYEEYVRSSLDVIAESLHEAPWRADIRLFMDADAERWENAQRAVAEAGENAQQAVAEAATVSSSDRRWSWEVWQAAIAEARGQATPASPEGRVVDLTSQDPHVPEREESPPDRAPVPREPGLPYPRMPERDIRDLVRSHRPSFPESPSG